MASTPVNPTSAKLDPDSSCGIIQNWANLSNHIPQNDEILRLLWSEGHPGQGEVGWLNAKSELVRRLICSSYASPADIHVLSPVLLDTLQTVGSVAHYLGW